MFFVPIDRDPPTGYVCIFRGREGNVRTNRTDNYAVVVTAGSKDLLALGKISTGGSSLVAIYMVELNEGVGAD